MRAHLAFLVLAVSAAPAAAQTFDHYDPSVLVARAHQAMREDDFLTACVLLSRAGQLAPHDARVELAWGDYAARQNGVPLPDAAVAKSDAATAPVKPVAPEPPAPWPVK
jgi:hypothetical protein